MSPAGQHLHVPNVQCPQMKLVMLFICLPTGFVYKAVAQETVAEEDPYAASNDPYEYDPYQEVAEIATFPYCVCEDYRCSTSPYRITELQPSVGPVNTKLCYEFQYVSTAPLCVSKLSIPRIQ